MTTVVAGLGNPGPRYENTRHNVGFWFVDYLAHCLDFGDFTREGACLVTGGPTWGLNLLLVKPHLYMNRSGQALSALWKQRPFESNNLIVCFDDVALEPGRIRLRARGTAGGHNGMSSIIEAMGTTEIARLRFGVGGPDADTGLAEHVLDEFRAEEENAVLDRFPDAVEALRVALTESMEQAMSRFNR